MKKVISMLLVLLLMLVAITGCGQNKGNNEVSGNTDTNVENTVDNGNTANEKNLKIRKRMMETQSCLEFLRKQKSILSGICQTLRTNILLNEIMVRFLEWKGF